MRRKRSWAPWFARRVGEKARVRVHGSWRSFAMDRSDDGRTVIIRGIPADAATVELDVPTQ